MVFDTNESDDFFIRLQSQMNNYDINKISNNLKTHELGILDYIDNNSKDKGGVYVSEIAKSMDLPMSAVSRILKRLEDELHYIKRKSDPKDRRNTLVTLTAEGKDEKDSIMKYAREIGSRIFDCLTPEEQKLFMEMCEKLGAAADLEYSRLYQQNQYKGE